MSVLDRCRATARARAARVVFPEAGEPRVAEAMLRLRDDALCDPVPVSDITDAQFAALVDGRGVAEGVARRMLARPLIRAAAMVAAGEADAMVAGADAPTRR
ncbi:MAG: phosphate acyltransferase, partial [Proteobacteria bacterium]|nr:phosphate acyltransferase [Pseudomonadota bacterium]